MRAFRRIGCLLIACIAIGAAEKTLAENTAELLYALSHDKAKQHLPNLTKGFTLEQLRELCLFLRWHTIHRDAVNRREVTRLREQANRYSDLAANELDKSTKLEDHLQREKDRLQKEIWLLSREKHRLEKALKEKPKKAGAGQF